MKTVAIIAEYNPFHNGHKFQIDKIREIFGDETNIVCIMSGNYVQRGDFAIFDKHTRAKCAILGGANLVFELPLPYVVSSAEFFARGAVSVLDNLGCIDYLCFGSECGDIDKLWDISRVLTSEKLQNDIKKCMQTGISYPNALDQVLSDYDASFGEIIKNPNNTLGIEYIKSLISLKSDIKPITITRKNTGYHSDEQIDGIASASYIRKNIDEEILHLMPEKCADIIKNIPNISMYSVENSILTYLKRKNSDYFAKIRDCNEGLEYKIVTELKIATSLDDLLEKIKSKRYTQSRIRRIILNSYLEIYKEYTEILPQYAKVLAFDDDGRKILKKLKETCKIPVITKPAGDYNFCEDGKKMINLDILATDLYFMAHDNPKSRVSGFEMKTSPIYVAN
ncbi:MAG: nucleotidyltransferase [Clostridia bacterium]